MFRWLIFARIPKKQPIKKRNTTAKDYLTIRQGLPINLAWLKDKEVIFLHTRCSDFGKTAFKLLKGVGLEIGALSQAFDLDAAVIYLDKYSKKELMDLYKDEPGISEIHNVHLVAKSDYYDFIDDEAFDFVVSSHVLEHTCNPGRIIEEWLRIVKPETGIVYFVVPDKNYSFDRGRPETTTQHLLNDYHNNVQCIEYEHYKDFLINTNDTDSPQDTDIPQNEITEESILECYNRQASIHVHTFTYQGLTVILERLEKLIPMEIIHCESQGLHIHIALKKQ